MTTPDTSAHRPPTSASGALGRAQRRAHELNLLARYAAVTRKGPLRAARVSVSEGSMVQVSGVDASRTVFVEPHVLTESVAPEQVWGVVQDLFKLALVARTQPGARVVLLVAGEPAAASVRRLLTSASGLSIVEVEVADLDRDETARGGIDFAGSC